ncbi:thermonuclease family protein [Pseudahrensia aquimaris]|uniref:Thermonuclease family protein n=1 Tax=Pseudahrensia aquimaris TaxID=744461 RepID=A0ABW3FAZ8_9HYPH
MSGSTVELYGISEKPDRYKRYSAHVFIKDRWVQGKALKAGAAIFDGQAGRSECVDEMMRLEREAIAAKKGVWSGKMKVFQSQDVAAISAKSGQMVLVEGVVQSIGDRSSRLYLNFGQKWSEDFTGFVRRKGREAYRGDINELVALKGKRIRIRGVLEESGGPMIRIFHEAQISIED